MFLISDLDQNEKNLVIQSYVLSNKRMSLNLLVDKDHYYQVANKRILNFIESDDYRIKTLKAKDVPGVVLAFLIYSNAVQLTVHYLFVKFAYRKSGVGRYLLSSVLDKDQPLITDHLPFSLLDKHQNIKRSKFMGYKLIFKPELETEIESKTNRIARIS